MYLKLYSVGWQKVQKLNDSGRNVMGKMKTVPSILSCVKQHLRLKLFFYM